MNIKVDIYTKRHGLTTIQLDDSDIEDLAVEKFHDRSSIVDEITNVVIDKVEI